MKTILIAWVILLTLIVAGETTFIIYQHNQPTETNNVIDYKRMMMDCYITQSTIGQPPIPNTYQIDVGVYSGGQYLDGYLSQNYNHPTYWMTCPLEVKE